jgi:hypothetical protein
VEAEAEERAVLIFDLVWFWLVLAPSNECVCNIRNCMDEASIFLMMNFLREKVVGEILEKKRMGCDLCVWRRRRMKERKERIRVREEDEDEGIFVHSHAILLI